MVQVQLKEIDGVDEVLIAREALDD
jgi:hypothetical protein